MDLIIFKNFFRANSISTKHFNSEIVLRQKDNTVENKKPLVVRGV